MEKWATKAEFLRLERAVRPDAVADKLTRHPRLFRFLRNFRIFTIGLMVFDGTTISPASGTITVSKSHHIIDSPTSTSVRTIRGGKNGQLLLLQSANAPITLRPNGNITGGPVVLVADKTALLFKNPVTELWNVVIGV